MTTHAKPTYRGKPYICSACHHALVLHERDDENKVAACCVEGCKCGHETHAKATSGAWVSVIGGRFSCESCGATWVGSWHGPRNQMTCLVCKKLLYPETNAR